MTVHLYKLILILGFSFSTGNTHSEIYRWVDAQGNVHFSDKSHNNPQAVDISVELKQHNIDDSAKRIQTRLQQIDQRQQAQAIEAQQRQSKNHQQAEKRQGDCRNAKSELLILQGPVVFFDDNKQQIKVTEAERQQRVDLLLQQIKKYCP